MSSSSSFNGYYKISFSENHDENYIGEFFLDEDYCHFKWGAKHRKKLQVHGFYTGQHSEEAGKVLLSLNLVEGTGPNSQKIIIQKSELEGLLDDSQDKCHTIKAEVFHNEESTGHIKLEVSRKTAALYPLINSSLANKYYRVFNPALGLGHYVAEIYLGNDHCRYRWGLLPGSKHNTNNSHWIHGEFSGRYMVKNGQLHLKMTEEHTEEAENQETVLSLREFENSRFFLQNGDVILLKIEHFENGDRAGLSRVAVQMSDQPVFIL